MIADFFKAIPSHQSVVKRVVEDIVNNTMLKSFVSF